MIFANLVKRNKEFSPDTFDRICASEITKLIRKKYSLDRELSILRQRDSKPEEFAEYNSYAEECKAQIKQLLK
jgi:hypothetical protein